MMVYSQNNMTINYQPDLKVFGNYKEIAGIKHFVKIAIKKIDTLITKYPLFKRFTQIIE